MKNLICAAMVVFFAASAFAQDVVLKECRVQLKDPESSDTLDMTMKVIEKSDKSLRSLITQTRDGLAHSYEDVAEVSESSVRSNLSSKSNTDNLNEAEMLVVHAMMFEEEPSLQGAFRSGIDLKQVRSAKLFTIGERAELGSATVVEARDENNQVLGSFLDGFLVSPCL